MLAVRLGTELSFFFFFFLNCVAGNALCIFLCSDLSLSPQELV